MIGSFWHASLGSAWGGSVANWSRLVYYTCPDHKFSWTKNLNEHVLAIILNYVPFIGLAVCALLAEYLS